MSQKHIQYLSATIILAALFTACEKQSSTQKKEQTQQNNQQTNPPNDTTPPSGNCTRFTEAAVVKVNGPSTAEVNTEVTLNVDYGVINGCGGFGRFEITESDFNYSITLIAKYEGCLCTANAPILKTTYKFKPSKAGVYYFKFKRGIQQPVAHQVTVGGTFGSK
jgi:hypothetical protein